MTQGLSDEGEGQGPEGEGQRPDGERRGSGERRQAGRRASDPAVGEGERRLRDGAVVITGICGRLGRRLARALHRERPVIGLDGRPFEDRPKDVEHHELHLQRRAAQDVFRGGNIGAVVHLGVRHDPRVRRLDHHLWNVVGFQKLLEWVRRYEIPKLIVLSSANVYGPRPDNAQFLTEDAPLLGSGLDSQMSDLVELDMLVQSFFWKDPKTETVLLRPAHILGSVRNAPSNYLRLRVVPTLLGFDPVVQVVHQEDVVRGILQALRPGARGIFNLAGPPPVALSRALRELGRPTVPVPHSLAKRMFGRMWSVRLSSFPTPELEFIRYVCMVDDRRARDLLGYAPAYDLSSTLRAVDEERWA